MDHMSICSSFLSFFFFFLNFCVCIFVYFCVIVNFHLNHIFEKMLRHIITEYFMCMFHRDDIERMKEDLDRHEKRKEKLVKTRNSWK